MNGTIIAALPVAAMFGFAGYRVGTGRGRPVLGAVLGFALGLIGWASSCSSRARLRRRRGTTASALSGSSPSS